jgi:cytochrome P450
MSITPATPVPTLDGFDPLSQEFLRDPGPILERARRECPVFFYEPLQFWMVTRYADVAKVAPDHETFASNAGVVPIPDEFAADDLGRFFRESFMSINPPHHTSSRKLAQKAFTRSRVSALEPFLRETAHDLIDAFAAEGSAEIMSRYCYQLSLRGVTTLIGLPQEDLERFSDWAQDIPALVSPAALAADGGVPTDTPIRPMPAAERQERWARVADARRYLTAFVEERLAQPRDDLTSAMLHAKLEDGRTAMSVSEVVTHLNEMIAAGTETTANAIAHIVMQLDERPELLERLRAEPRRWEDAVDEGLRRRPVAIGMFRVATRDVELGGVTIPAGAIVCISYASVGHDEAQYACPMDFDIDRGRSSEDLTFGKGRHFCLGAPLARTEARIGLEVLYERLPDLHVVPDQEYEYEPAMTAFMLHRLEAAWTPEEHHA